MEFISQHPVLVASLVKILVLLFIVMTALAYLTWIERKVIARIQSRWGPYYVGAHGLLQPLADGLKFLFKEDVTPPASDKFLYVLAPFLALSLSLTTIALIPFGPPKWVFPNGQTIFIVSDLDIGLLFLFAITSIGVYGVALAGWSSNSKYSLMGGLRSSAQMISYEVSLTISVVGVLLLAGTLNFNEIIARQSGNFLHWNVIHTGPGFFPQIVGFLCYLTAAIAETNRIPFDLPEAETELVAGFHTEYSAFKFAMFFMAEYANMINVGCVATLLFFGGWTSPFGNLIEPPQNIFVHALMPIFWFVFKVFCFLFLYVWVRGTLPRFRYDQLMGFAWKFLFPVAMLNLLVTGFLVALRS